jgi:ElaB/YqjD/DUF883 family membrane-anchored ribosome-binding protein
MDETLRRAGRELSSLAAAAESEMSLIAQGFQALAGYSATLLDLAAQVVDRVEHESVGSMLPAAQTLGSTARKFVQARLRATTGILDTVTREITLLRQLSLATHSQNALAVKTRVMTVLTNVEAARLGAEGVGFQHLANDLASFSNSLTRDTEELCRHIDERRPMLEKIRVVLSDELPRLQQESLRIDTGMATNLATLETALNQIAGTPVQFRGCVEQITQQIGGVVAAVQSHDITRQQLEHVEQALETMASGAAGLRRTRGSCHDPSVTRAALEVQTCQLRNIQTTVSAWTSQMQSCMQGIMGVSAAGLSGISPLVLAQEKEISANLAHIHTLERQSQASSQRIRQTVSRQSNLLQLVEQHVERAKSIRYRLHLLSLNSIVEASRLGNRADAILEIAKIISDVAVEWSEITAGSDQVMQEILQLAAQIDSMMETFSEAANRELRKAQSNTEAALENLRKAAAFAAAQSQKIAAGTEKMQAMSGEAARSSTSLTGCYARIHAILEMIASAQRRLERDHPEATQPPEPALVERLYGSAYTTEIERAVMHAALYGTELPTIQQHLVGNGVELF